MHRFALLLAMFGSAHLFVLADASMPSAASDLELRPSAKNYKLLAKELQLLGVQVLAKTFQEMEVKQLLGVEALVQTFQEMQFRETASESSYSWSADADADSDGTTLKMSCATGTLHLSACLVGAFTGW